MAKRASIGRLALAAIIGAVLPFGVVGQEPLSLGDRIRVQQPDGTVLTGTVGGVSAGGVRLFTAGNEEFDVSLDRMETLERSVGKERHFANNFALTVVGVAALGGVVGAVTWKPCRETGFLACFLHPDSRGQAFGYGLAIGGAVGLPVGVLVGLARRYEVWEPISVPAPSGLALDVRPVVGLDHLGFSASIAVGGF